MCVLLGSIAQRWQGQPDKIDRARQCVKLLLEHKAEVNLASGPVSCTEAYGPHGEGIFGEGDQRRASSMTALHMVISII